MSSKKFIQNLLLGGLLALWMGAAHAEDVKLIETCVVNGERFAERQNPPVKVTYEGTSIMVCCKRCVKKFARDPEKYVKAYQEELSKKAAAK